jgi:hypothetical protein
VSTGDAAALVAEFRRKECAPGQITGGGLIRAVSDWWRATVDARTSRLTTDSMAVQNALGMSHADARSLLIRNSIVNMRANASNADVSSPVAVLTLSWVRRATDREPAQRRTWEEAAEVLLAEAAARRLR